jgi:hypothetical protein
MKARLQDCLTMNGADSAEECDQILDMYQVWIGMVAVRERILRPVPTINFGFDDVPEFCGTDYRFRSREHLRELHTRLQVPAYFRLPNGKKVRGEHAFLFFLRRFSNGSRIHDLIPVFGGEKSSWSRVFNKFARYEHALNTRLLAVTHCSNK